MRDPRSIGNAFVWRSIYQFAWAVLAVMASATGAHAGMSNPPTYTLMDLGTLPGATGSSAAALNNRGDVVGDRETRHFCTAMEP